MMKFVDPDWTATGEPRAIVALSALRTLWFNTGTLCNITCEGCYIESSPSNDSLVYLTAQEVHQFLVEAKRDHPQLAEIGFTGGEPFMNPDIVLMLSDALASGYRVLVLTNAMAPMRHHQASLLRLKSEYGDRLAVRVSLDDFTEDGHERVRGPRTWLPAITGLRWLSDNQFPIAVAARLMDRDEKKLRSGFSEFFEKEAIAIDARDSHTLVLFPEMDASADVPEITGTCWSILNKSPSDVMCASSRMVVKRKGDPCPLVVSCTLLPDEKEFEMGRTLAEAQGAVRLNHPHCARFCVLGGASCSA